MTKLQAYRFLSSKDSTTAFIANVIFNGCSNAAAKLKSMVELVQAGHQLSTTSFTMPYDGIQVDGYWKTWEQILAGGAL